MLTRIKMALVRFMQGRNGIDNIGYHALWGGIITSLLDTFLGPGLLGLAGTVLYVYAIWRMMSRNTAKRQEENRRYVQFTGKIGKEVQQFFLRLKGMKTYKYFRCPSCKNRLRLKRGSGEKHITCPVCKHQFDQKA
ncbi:MAG: hypothetical protein IJ438_00800 [Clostridia bacterium]|nr:hypothetical protein [Clostridia bacterium]